MTAGVNEFFDQLRDELQVVLQDAGDERGTDPILDQLEKLLAGRVTSPRDQEERAGCVAEANRRIDPDPVRVRP